MLRGDVPSTNEISGEKRLWEEGETRGKKKSARERERGDGGGKRRREWRRQTERKALKPVVIIGC